MAKKILLFDIDGTLLLTGGAGRIAFEKAMEDLFGVPDAWGKIVPDGKTDPLIIEELFQAYTRHPIQADEYRKLCERYHDYFAREILVSDRYRLMPGIPGLLQHLNGFPHLLMGIATGNFEQAAYHKLKRGKLEHFFRFGGYGSDSSHRGELTLKAYQRGCRIAGETVSPAHVWVIGDTVHDIDAGRWIEARTVAVCTGSTPREMLESRDPDFLFDDLTGLEAFLEVIGESRAS